MRATALFCLAVSSGAALGCGGHSAALTRPAVVGLGPVEGAPPESSLPPLTSSEREIEAELRAIISHLSVDVGERHLEKSWNLAETTDDLARRLEKMGYPVRRQGFAVGEEVLQNLEVTVPGKEHGDESIVVCAHFDTVKGSPGADDNASGAAAVTALARLFIGKKPSRAVRFALFANGAEPSARSTNTGSLYYAKDLRKQGVHVSAVLNLQSLGYFSEAAKSQKQPATGATPYPSAGSFVLVASDPKEKALGERVRTKLSAHTALPVIADAAVAAVSDDWAFLEVGMPVATVTDTGTLRNPHQGSSSDLPDTLDFERMARLVSGLSGLIEDLSAQE